MAETPTLTTRRLALAPFTDEHLTEHYVDWLNDPEVVRYSEQRHRRHTIESCRQWAAGFDDGPSQLWAIMESAHGLGHIGNINTDVDEPNRTADIAILIGDKRSWGQGYGAEAWIAVVEYLLGPGGMRKVTAGTMADNRAMMAIMRRSGMAEEGRRRRQFLFEGREVDAILAARFADDG